MKKVFFYLLASMFAAIMFITSCNPNNQDDETNTDGDESVEEEEIVNPDYLSIDWENATVLSSNDSIGEYQITFSGDMPDIIPGSVLTIDQDTIVRYDFVESVEMDGNIANIRTSAAYLTDIFSNTTITLASDNNQRGNNVFLPTEIFYFDDNGEKCEIYLNANRDDNFGFTHDVWNFSDNLDGTELLSGENYKIYMEKLSYNFDLDFVMEMNFGGRNIVEIMSNGLERYKSKAMNIETSLVGNFDTEQTLRYDVEGEGQYSPGYDLWKHNFFRPMTIKFSVYGVPVVINLRADLFREVELSTEGEISAYVGFSEHANGKLGFNWAQSGTMTPINSFSNTFTFVPPTVEGRGSIEAKAWAFPRISMMLYGVIGPSFDFKPYLSTTLNGGFKEEMLGSNNDFCAWSFDCNTGLDAACGLSLGFMGYETENYSTDDFNIIDKTLYHSPERIELVPMQQKMRAGEGKDVEFNVYDRNYLADAEVLTSLPQFVKFEGDGEFSEKYGIAKSGVVSVKWTPSSEEDVMYARLYDVEGSVVSEAEFTEEGFCDPDGEIAGHGYVDLGLPSGKKWATCNVGATTPEGYGNYYAWGETSPKAEYTWENSVTYGEQMSDLSGNPQYDAATANWGGGWRMPTKDEMNELENNCEWEWTQVNGVHGARVVGPNGNCIFLPAVGIRGGSSLGDDGRIGRYWSSTPDESGTDHSYYLYFDCGYHNVDWNLRSLGLSVRPVSE